MKPSKTFRGRLDRRTFNINFYANCGTCNIVYLITCNCGLQYVGKTIRPLRKRVSEHLGSVTRGDCSSAVSKHLIEIHDSKICITVQVIDRVVADIRKGDIDNSLLRKEAYWIHRLNTVTPHGLNREWELTCFIDR
ncbi:hypothetical protein XELAEV_18001963mg [Xenopus laevis]|uniref:GIY-YIG domain-containing protein n=1 Tax=Xenopus laevis TaxID=8355 RepID=A0A974BPV2_XENLA|nr:hypothetical protein XELAEV_18001963mg [Xenopus laevis]